jgi:hypothetical protein
VSDNPAPQARRSSGPVFWIVVVLVFAVAIGFIAAMIRMWDGMFGDDPWREFQRSTSDDGRWTVILEQQAPFVFGPTPVRVLFQEEGGKVVRRGELSVPNDGRPIGGCGVGWRTDTVLVVCSGDEGRDEVEFGYG